jgi:hypothetical protein
MNIAAKRHRRWGDNDKRFGPFTYSSDSRYRPFAVVLSSGGDEDEGGYCHLRASLMGRTLIVELPAIVKPYREKIVAHSWDAATVARLGRDWYWQIEPRDFGFYVSDGFLQVFRGRRTGDSSTDRTWSKFLPWTEWRFVRHSFYGLDGSHFVTDPYAGKSCLGDPGRYERQREMEASVPTASFEFDDFDGERIVAKTKIEEREWKRGAGWFKWLSLVWTNKVRRSLDIEFSSETGRRKGSWKGGTIGTGIDMRPGELHEPAFRRYCQEHGMTFVSSLPTTTGANQ